ncbi:hypothetical protein GCM10027589_01060 [Actinocorallia lasiicapitis]
MRRVLLALVSALALVLAVAPAAEACEKCVKLVEPKPCKGISRCDWGGDPDGVFVEVRAKTKKAALAKARQAVKNVKGAKVRPRTLDVLAFHGKKRVLSKTYRLSGPHYVYDEKQECWTAV